MTIAGMIAYYTWTTYLPTVAATTAGVDRAQALLVSTIALFFFLIIQPIGGILSDRIGRRLPLIIFAAAFTVLTVPALSIIAGSATRLLIVQLIGMVFLTLYTSIAAAVNAETIPTRVRASGIGFPYSLAVALFGGTAPYVGTLFASMGVPSAFPFYVSGLCLISLVVYVVAVRDGHRSPLP